MKKTKNTKKPTPAIQNPQPTRRYPKYYLEDVPHEIRARVLDLCTRRLYHEALKLLRQRRLYDYTQDDLINFYHWAPARLGPPPAEPDHTTPRDYAQPSPEQLADIHQRLAQVPPDLIDRVHDALRNKPIDVAASLLWKAGAGFGSAELYEYRKTLFPPNSLLDPYTSGPPVLRPAHFNRAADVSDRTGSTENLCPSIPTQEPEPTTCLTEVPQPPLQPLSADPNAATVADPVPCFPINPLMQSSAPPSTQLSPSVISVPSVALSVNPSALLTDLRDVIKRYVVLPEHAAETLALWIVHTYAFTLRQVTTYIGVVSPEKRCGKTTLLELLGLLAHEAIAAANISPSALFRVIEEDQPTLIIDEADTFLHGRDEMAGILNAGYRKGNSYVVRVSTRKSQTVASAVPADLPPATPHSSKNPTILARYSCWCPKVMAAIGRLPDTLADRCILITMQRKLAGEKCDRLRHLDPAPFHQRCADFVQAHRDAIAKAQPDIPASLNDRAADIWEPLLAIADLAGCDWPALARQAAEKLSAADDDIPLIAHFLFDIRTWMRLHKLDRILSRDIIATFDPVHTRPWEDLRRGRPINEYWLASQMRALAIRPKHLRFRHSTGRGYLIQDIESALRRYVPNLPAQAPCDPNN